MKVSVTPVLQSLRDIYDVEGVMPRFDAYVSLMTGAVRGEFLPLGVFSPMGKRQADYLDSLLALDAEALAVEAIEGATDRLALVSANYRLLLVVVDVAGNGWTERYLTDSEWRFYDKYNELPQEASPVGFDRWVTVQLWTDVEPTATYISQETQAAIYRTAHLRAFGRPTTLEAMMLQEGRAMAFAGFTPDLDAEDIEYSREVIKPLLNSTDEATCFTALYGDEIAQTVGYKPLGLSAKAAMNVGLANALKEGSAELYLKNQAAVLK